MLRHSHRKFAVGLLPVLMSVLTACPGPHRPGSGGMQEPVLKPVPGAQIYTVDPAQSLLRILVYRGGAMAQAGHNHVVASHDLSGTVYLHHELRQSAFEVLLPVE